MNLNEWFYFSHITGKLALDGNYCPQGKHVVKCSPVLTCPNWWTSVKWISVMLSTSTVCWRGIIKAKGCFKKKKNVQRRGSFFILDFNRVKNNISSSTDVAWVRSPGCRRCHCSAPLPLREATLFTWENQVPGSLSKRDEWRTVWKPCGYRVKAASQADSHSVCSWCRLRRGVRTRSRVRAGCRVQQAWFGVKHLSGSRRGEESGDAHNTQCESAAFMYAHGYLRLYGLLHTPWYTNSRAMGSVMSDTCLSYRVASLKRCLIVARCLSPVTAISYHSLCIIIKRILNMNHFTIYKPFLYLI